MCPGEIDMVSQNSIFYFIHHGQTDWNLEGKIQGQTDIPLNEIGRAQCHELKKELAKIEFTHCYSSDLKRASETAHIIMKGLHVRVLLDWRLRERNFGEMEGRYSSVYINALPHDLKKVESDKALTERIFQFLNEVTLACPKGIILIVTHVGVMRAALSKFLGLTCRDVEIKVGNNAMMKVIVENGYWNVEEIRDMAWPS